MVKEIFVAYATQCVVLYYSNPNKLTQGTISGSMVTLCQLLASPLGLQNISSFRCSNLSLYHPSACSKRKLLVALHMSLDSHSLLCLCLNSCCTGEWDPWVGLYQPAPQGGWSQFHQNHIVPKGELRYVGEM